MKKILLIEDNKGITEGLCDTFTEPEYELLTAGNLKEAGVLLSEHPGLVLLDVSLPDGNGFDFYSERLEKEKTPVIFLTAKDEENDIVKGIELGAEDYITKPFSLSVLRARVNTQLRKAESLQAHTSASVYRKGCYEFDFERMIFLVDGQEIELSKTEQRLLRLLVQNEGINLRRDFLLDRVWNDSAEFVDANALSVSVKRLRDKLGIPDSIKTVYGIGYRFE